MNNVNNYGRAITQIGLGFDFKVWMYFLRAFSDI